MVGEACLPSNAYYPRTPDYTLYSGVHVCWSEHSDSSFAYGFMSLDDGLCTMTATTLMSTLKYYILCNIVCVEVLRPSQPNGVMSSAVSLPNHTFTGQA